MLDLLHRFDPFRDYPRSALATVADHARVLRFPAGRWLVRRGRHLDGSYFLVRGQLWCFDPDRRLRHGTRLAERAVYPGCKGIRTASQADLLWIDTRALGLLFDGAEGPDGRACADSGLLASLEPWERRLLGAPGMRRVGPARWQHLFSQFEERAVAAGEDVLCCGRPARNFYVLKRGRAAVHRAGRALARLVPGDFFGEDALILGAVRNATVTMLEDGAVLHLPASALLQLLADGIVRTAAAPLQGQCLDVESFKDPGSAGSAPVQLGTLREQLAGLDPSCPCYLTGGSAAERTLATFILTCRGFDAYCVVDPAVHPVEPAPTARAAASVGETARSRVPSPVVQRL